MSPAISTAGCFPAGTRLLTSRGERAVEALLPGDELVTIRDGGPGLRGIARVTRLRFAAGAVGARALPRRIRAGAFAPEMPAQDLILFGDHAIYADAALYELADLENASSIVPHQACVVTAYRIELDGHDIVLAEGMPVESAPPAPEAPDPNIAVLYPAWRPAPREARCLPCIAEGAELEALRRVVDHRAGRRRRAGMV